MKHLPRRHGKKMDNATPTAPPNPTSWKTRHRRRSAPSPAPEDDRRPNLLDDSLAYTIKRAQIRCDEALMQYLDAGISPARFAALCTVGSNPGISQATLGSLLNIAGPSVVKVVDDLEKMNLLRRDKSANRRLHALQLTKKGAGDLKRYTVLVAKFESEIAAALTMAERNLLLTLLTKVAPSQR
jgi:DNA-binding MarR family transcriptional regulator